MKRFRGGERVCVTNKEMTDIVGKKGTVTRLRRGDDGAWVKLDDKEPIEGASFTGDPSDSRYNSVILFPEDCEEIVG